jgi:hypothetical protein
VYPMTASVLECPGCGQLNVAPHLTEIGECSDGGLLDGNDDDDSGEEWRHG